MEKQTQQSKNMSSKVDDLVAIKIHKANKVSNLHANMLIAKILEIDSTTNYVKVVTQYGIIKGQIALSRLNPTKVAFNYSQEVTLTMHVNKCDNHIIIINCSS